MTNEEVKKTDEPVASPSDTPPSPESGSRYYIRFTVPQRYLHGVLAITFLGLALTGLPLRFSNTRVALALAHMVGGFGTILFFHLLNAVLMTIAFLIHLGNVMYRVVAHKEYGLLWGPNSMVPRLKDIQDFRSEEHTSELQSLRHLV